MSKGPQTRITATQRIKVMLCRDCNKPMNVGTNTRNRPRCLECAGKLVIDNAIQMHEKSGPAYDRWRLAMAKAVERANRGSGEG